MAYVYQHVRLDTNEVFYVGIAKIKTRISDQRRRSEYWKRVVSKAGYKIEIIAEGITWEDACKKERELIDYYGRKDKGLGPLVNMTDGGEGTVGIKRGTPSEETKQKISNANKGKKLKPLSEEHRQKLSDIKKGSKMSEQARKIMSDAHKGKKLSEEHKQKISIARKSK